MDMTVTNGAYEYLLITDHALITVEWRSSEADRQVVVGAVLGHVGHALREADGLLGPGRTSVLGLDDGPRVPAFLEISGIHRCRAGGVPSELSNHRQWPRVESTRPVAIYPRATVRSVRLRWWGAYRVLFAVECPDLTGGINLWHVPRARQHLQRSYPLA